VNLCSADFMQRGSTGVPLPFAHAWQASLVEIRRATVASLIAAHASGLPARTGWAWSISAPAASAATTNWRSDDPIMSHLLRPQ
jgi:hypothetical protein